ncbi:helix-turn-helix transcriptional regulator [Larkinella soli]|uniref:helix-turn-helix transcriptional regulator n=1 Tax=Larkinella soli TaxID=1770527 RepID=UPI000FFCB722|nr:YafY family protein [Larkinella soli]
MNRIDRLTAILIHLQTKRVVRAQELADRFGISLRTVYRDVRALEEAGVPIGAEAGIGYFLENYHLPPVMLTREEAGALLLGGKLIEKWTDASVQTEFASALYKIKSVLKRHDQEHLEDLEPRVHVHRHPSAPAFSDGLLNGIQQAIVQCQVLEIEYYSSYNEETTRREVEPVGLYHYGTGWHLIAFCRLRQDYRDFRVERIRRLQPTGSRYSKQNLISLPAYLEMVRRTQNLQEVVVDFHRSAVRYCAETKYTYGFVSEEEAGGRVRMRFLTQYPEGMGRWLLMFGSAVTVETSDALKDELRKLALEVQRHYLTENITS